MASISPSDPKQPSLSVLSWHPTGRSGFLAAESMDKLCQSVLALGRLYVQSGRQVNALLNSYEDVQLLAFS